MLEQEEDGGGGLGEAEEAGGSRMSRGVRTSHTMIGILGAQHERSKKVEQWQAREIGATRGRVHTLLRQGGGN